MRRLYLDMGEFVDCEPDDPRLPQLADLVVAFLEAAVAKVEDVPDEHPISADLIALLDQAFIEYFPWARRLLAMLEERGWTGWTNIRRAVVVPDAG